MHGEAPDPSTTIGATARRGGTEVASATQERIADAALASEEAVIALQLRRATLLFVVLWVGSFVIDAVAAFGAAHVSPLNLLLARAIPVPINVYIHLRTRHATRITATTAQRFLLASDVSSALWLSILALETGGLDSQYQTTLMFVPLSLALVPLPSRQGMVRHAAVLTTYVGTMLVGHFVLGIGAGERTADDPWLFGVHAMMTNALSASMIAVSHTLYSLRREVFATKNVGRYELRRMLGKGGMGEVWAAWHTSLRREVALKLVRLGDASSDAAMRFEREVEAMTRLSHPNTVRIYDFGAEEGGLLYCAMELLEGEDLGALVRREGPLTFERTHRLLLQATSALAEAHSLGIVHRDVKPENIFVMRIAGDREIVKVLDFGIAVVVEQAETRITQRDALTGTPSTMSPEVVRGDTATPAADVYALGCVAYFMLSGQMPFGGKRTAAVLNAHLHELPLPPSVKSGDPIPLAFEALVMRCLEKNPERRFADASALADALIGLDARDLDDRPRMSNAPTDDAADRGSQVPPMVTLPGKSRRTALDE